MSGMHPPTGYGGRHAYGDDEPAYGDGRGYETGDPRAWRSGRSEYGEPGYGNSEYAAYQGYGATPRASGYEAGPGHRPMAGPEPAPSYGGREADEYRPAAAYPHPPGYPPSGGYGDHPGHWGRVPGYSDDHEYRSGHDHLGVHDQGAAPGYAGGHGYGQGYPAGGATYPGYPGVADHAERPAYAERPGDAGYGESDHQNRRHRGRATATVPPPDARRPPVESPARPSAPVKRRGRQAAVGAGVAVSVLALCVLVGWLVARPYLAQWPATLSKPEKVGGLELSTEPALQQKADEIASGLSADIEGDNALVAFYHDPADDKKLVALIGGTAFLASPKAQLDETFRGANTAEMPIGQVHDVDAGPLGGVARCADAQLRRSAAQGQAPDSQAGGEQTPGGQPADQAGGQADEDAMPLSICAWADHGSWVIGLFFNRPVNESADLLRVIRSEILKR
jgi:hypothetical protein